MSTWIKRLLFAFVALLIISLVGIAIFFLTFDPNAYRDRLEEFVYQRYERHLSIEGDIQLSLFPRIGLSVESVRLSEKGSEEPFAAVENMRFSVAVWPLLWNHLVVDHLYLEGVQAWFEVGLPADSVSTVPSTDEPEHRQIARAQPLEEQHWLLPAAYAQPLEEAVLPRLQRSEFQVDIAGLEVHDATIYFFDAQKRWSAEFKEVSISTGRMTLEQPFDLSMQGRLQSHHFDADLQIEGQAVATLAPYSHRTLVHRSQFQWSGQMGEVQVEQGELRGAVEYRYGQALDVEQFELSGQGRGKDGRFKDLALNVRAHSLGVHWAQQEIMWQDLQVRLQAEQEQRRSEFAIESPQLWMSATETRAEPLQASVRVAQGQEVFGGQLNMRGLASGWQNLHAEQLDVLGQYKNEHQSWRLQLQSPLEWSYEDEQLAFSDVHGILYLEDESLLDGFSARALEGSFFIQPFKGHAAGDLYGAEWLAGFPEADGSSLKNVVAPALTEHSEYLTWLLWFDENNRPARLITNLEADTLDVGQWVPEWQIADLNWVALPINWFWHIEAQQLKIGQLWLEKARLNGHWRQGGLELTEFQARFHEGSMQAHASWLESEQLHGYVKLDNIETSALLAGLGVQPFVQGLGDLEATWHTQGATIAAWLANLNMHTQVEIHEGAFIGFSVWQQIDAANEVLRQLFSADVPAMPEQFNPEVTTPFTAAQLNLRGMSGQLVFDQLEILDADYEIRLGHPAWVDLVNQQIDIVVLLSLQLADPEAHASHRQSFAQGIIPLRITGSLAAPDMRFQWADMPHRFIQEAINEGLLDVLGMPAHESFLSEIKRERTVVEALVEDTAKYFGVTLKDFLQKK